MGQGGVTPKFHLKAQTLYSVCTISASFSSGGTGQGGGRDATTPRSGPQPRFPTGAAGPSSASTKPAARGSGSWWLSPEEGWWQGKGSPQTAPQLRPKALSRKPSQVRSGLGPSRLAHLSRRRGCAGTRTRCSSDRTDREGGAALAPVRGRGPGVRMRVGPPSGPSTDETPPLIPPPWGQRRS